MSGNASADEAAIRAVMSAYEAALNASDTQAVMPLYADDSVFMPQNSQSVVGKAAVQPAYPRHGQNQSNSDDQHTTKAHPTQTKQNLLALAFAQKLASAKSPI
jgi:uncharacterized protein (TIGR02246 family)